MNNLQIFNNAIFGKIRTTEVDGQIYFVASDIAKVLKYNRPNDAVTTHCRYTVKRRIPHPQSKSKEMLVITIPESDIYRLVTHSKLPSAQEFESWIFDEVLPTIRKTGTYSVKTEQQSLPACIEDLIIQQATLLKELRLKLESQQQQIDELKHKPFSQFNTYRSCETWLRIKGIPFQRSFSWAFSRQCAKYSRENNIPVQQTGKKGYIVNAYREDVLERCFNSKLALPVPKNEDRKVIELTGYFIRLFDAIPLAQRKIVLDLYDIWKIGVPAELRDSVKRLLTISVLAQDTEPKKIRKAG